ncbi:hypothetical protein [Agromyces arachidis]|uniref:hypothetical protein n=1 Tax=Agromyces arachidis TaxID=766966 RepID=UPI00405776E9
MADAWNWFVCLLTPAQWEALRGWVTTLGGLTALGIAAGTYRHNVRVKREEQARLVYASVSHFSDHYAGDEIAPGLSRGEEAGVFPVSEVSLEEDSHGNVQRVERTTEHAVDVTVVVHNASKELIAPVRVQLLDGGRPIGDPYIDLNAIHPDQEIAVRFVIPNRHHPGFVVHQPTILFRDASGKWWRRNGAEPIEWVHNDPDNVGPTREARPRIREEQAAMGVPEDQQLKEPRVGFGVRLRRFWRRIRGKDARG